MTIKFFLQKRVFLYILNRVDKIKRKLCARDIYPVMQDILTLKRKQCNYVLDSTIVINSENFRKAKLIDIAHLLKPWRKGPYSICDTKIDSEWDSSIKFNTIKKYLDIEGKDVADVGCNNGYYMFRMLSLKPKSITGFDPSALCKCQFEFINHFIDSDIKFELLGIEDLIDYDRKFDCIICLGVLYHRMDPIGSLKILKNALNSEGEIIIDTLIIDTNEDIALSPLRYAKMKNVYFIPSKNVICNWLYRAGFKKIEVINIVKTTIEEQRKTKWINSQSLEDFLDPNDANKTIEGYQAPTRIYIKAT